MNNVKTFVLLAGLMGLFLLAGQLLGGSQGLLLALVLGGAFNFIMYFFSDRLVLRMYGAHVVTEEQAPELYRMVDRLRQRAGLPMPVVAVAPHEQPNAFATGRSPSKAVVAVTTGILGLDVLARGVESRPQQAFLSALGCRLQQGPLFGRPMKADEFRDYLARQRNRKGR